MIVSLIDSIRKLVRSFIHLIAAKLNVLSNGRITPNKVTTVGLLMHIPIAFLIAGGHLVISGILLIIFGLFDVLDGELARLQKTSSPFGMVYDATTDRIKETLIYAGLAFWLAKTGQSFWATWTVLALGLSISVSYAKAKAESALAVKEKLTDLYKLNRHYSEGLVAYELRVAILIIGLLFNLEILAVVVVTIMSVITNFNILYVINQSLS
ncbi:MAG: CDP-alcohol phosphatidyltransferase family protein, partial [Candidatus Saccharimonadales bacterium]